MTGAAQANPDQLFDSVAPAARGLLGFTFILAAMLHAVLIFAVNFDFPEPETSARRVEPLEIVVLRNAAPTDKIPNEADAYAQVNREGGGNDDERTVTDQRPIERTPEPPPEALEPPPEPVAPPIPEPPPLPQAMEEPTPEPMLTATIQAPKPIDQSPQPEPPSEPEPLPEPRSAPTHPVSAAQILASRSLEIAKLTAKIKEDTSLYASRIRRKAISASTKEYMYASYLESWRRKVERVGNLNYPDEAKQRKLYGNLILHVALRADGHIESLRVLRSSGFDVLDEAAIRIVELAAPFAPFPPDIKSETDILDITRTWQFLSTNRLGWEN